jgi:hypothetical protein
MSGTPVDETVLGGLVVRLVEEVTPWSDNSAPDG